MQKTIKTYKGFNKDLQCRGFQYEMGGEYSSPVVELCERGFGQLGKYHKRDLPDRLGEILTTKGDEK